MRKLLILGAGGYVGRNLYGRLGPDRAIATYNRAPVVGGRRFDATAMRLTDVVKRGEASHAAVLLADPMPDSCFADPVASRRLNVEAMERLIEDLWTLDIIPIFFSTDYVFDGDKGNYVETDPAFPRLLYGRQKKEVEDWLTASGKPHAILRIAKTYGETPGDGTFLSDWLGAMLGGQTSFRCAADQSFTPVFVHDVGDACLAAVKQDLRGLFHATSGQRLSRAGFLDLLIAELARHRPVDITVERCSIHDFPVNERRPVDTSLCSDKLFRTTGLAFQPVEVRIANLVRTALASQPQG